MTDKLVLLLFESWADLDRAVTGLTPGDASTRRHGGSSIAWTVGHVTNMLDSWINVRFQGMPPNPVISSPDFRTGGRGDAGDWNGIWAAVLEARQTARSFLASQSGSDLERVIPYDGSIKFLRAQGLRLRYAVMRIAAHHWMHTGEIETVRSRMGHTMAASPDWGKALV